MGVLLLNYKAPPPRRRPHLMLSPTEVGLIRDMEGVEMGLHAGVMAVVALDGAGRDMACMAGMGLAIGLDA